MMMSKGMDIVLIEEVAAPLMVGMVVALLMGGMAVEDPQVLIVEVGVALIMAVDQILLPDQNQEEAQSMNELKAQSMGDTTGMIHLINFYFLIFFFG